MVAMRRFTSKPKENERTNYTYRGGVVTMQEKIDKVLGKWASRKLIVWGTATVFLAMGSLTSSDWVAVSLAYIGLQGAADIAADSSSSESDIAETRNAAVTTQVLPKAQRLAAPPHLGAREARYRGSTRSEAAPRRPAPIRRHDGRRASRGRAARARRARRA